MSQKPVKPEYVELGRPTPAPTNNLKPKKFFRK